MKKFIIIGIFIIALVGLYYFFNPLIPVVRFPTVTYHIELAISNEEKMKGLSYRERLDPKHGMLFLYNRKDQYSYWMKNMKIPLDFIWLYGNLVVDLTENVSADQTIPLPVITPKTGVDKVLEVNAGDIAKYGIKIGDTAIFR
jgi:uncharacterized membrane protein (UPF0127 family)